MTKNRSPQGAEQATAGRTAGGKFAPGVSGNPHGARRRARSAASTAAQNMDGWSSLLSGLGTMRDKREHTMFIADTLLPEQCEALYRGDDLAARIVETLPKAATRQGFDLTIVAEDDAGPDKAESEIDGDGRKVGTSKNAPKKKPKPSRDFAALKKEVEHRWTELGLVGEIRKAWNYARAYGGAAILIGAEDGSKSLDEPLMINNVRSLAHLTTLEAREVTPIAWYGNPRAKKFGQPAIYQLTPMTPGQTVDGMSFVQTIFIHETRLLVFDGVRISRRQIGNPGGWGDPVLNRVNRVLRDFNLSWGAAGSLVVDFAQAIYKMKGLNDLLNDDPTDIFKRRMLGMEMSRSVARATLIDSEDEFTRVVTPVSGLPDLLDRFTTRLAMAAELPLSLLAGESPGGLNASGASGDQLRMFYDNAKLAAVEIVIPAITYVSKILFQLLGGEPAQWSVEGRPLWQSTQLEILAEHKTQAETDVLYLDRGVLHSSEVRKSRYGGKSFSFETTIENEEPLAEIPSDEIEAFAAEEKKGAVDPKAPPASKTPSAPTVASGPDAAGAAGADIQKQVLNGAQMAALLEVITAVNEGRISRASGIAVLRIAVQLAEADAVAILGPEDFEAKVPEPAPSPFGGGAPPAFTKKPDVEPAGDRKAPTFPAKDAK